ncbi:MAG: glycosyltransferase family 4 protein [bacterium]
MITIAAFVVAMFSTMVMTPPLKQLAERLGFVDIPDARKVHTRPVPRIGGVAIIVASAIPLLLWAAPSSALWGYLLGGAVILVFGIADDRFDLDFRIKFVGQVIAVLLAIFVAGIEINHLPFTAPDAVISRWFSVPLTLFLVLAVINAVNFTDGLDGLAGGIVLLSLCGMAVLAYGYGNYLVGLIAVALIGAILGFLHFNSHPAQLFMGDVGSQFLGYALASLSILLTQTGQGVFPVGLPLLLIGLPLIDMTVVTVNRKLSGQSAFAPDKTHIHHRLMSIGLSHLEAVLWVYFLQASLVALAYFLRFSSDVVIGTVFTLITVVQIVLFRYLASHNLNLQGHFIHLSGSWLVDRINVMRRGGGMGRVACVYTTIAIALYYLFSSVLISNIPPALVLFSLVLLLVLVGVRTFTKNEFSEWLERVGYYMVALSSVYLVQFQGLGSQYEGLLKGFFFGLAVVVLLGMHYSGDLRIKARPLDFLILIVAIVIPPILNSLEVDSSFVYASYYLLVLFYAIEMLLALSPFFFGQQKYLKALFILPLLVFVVRGVLS